MLFNSFVFIFFFLPVVLVFYFGLNKIRCYHAAKVVLVLASLYFYAFFNWSYLPIILSSIAVNYFVGYNITYSIKPNVRKTYLFFGVAFNVGLLGYFKYSDFFIENINMLFQSNFALKHILLPLGISFFTFQIGRASCRERV